jgi:hypothetical protein
MRVSFTNVTSEDISYAELSDTEIEFGYITRKERDDFYNFLIDKRLIVNCPGTTKRATCNFSFTTVKFSKSDNCNLETVTVKRDWEVLKSKNGVVRVILRSNTQVTV